MSILHAYTNARKIASPSANCLGLRLRRRIKNQPWSKGSPHVAAQRLEYTLRAAAPPPVPRRPFIRSTLVPGTRFTNPVNGIALRRAGSRACAPENIAASRYARHEGTQMNSSRRQFLIPHSWAWESQLHPPYRWMACSTPPSSVQTPTFPDMACTSIGILHGLGFQTIELHWDRQARGPVCLPASIRQDDGCREGAHEGGATAVPLRLDALAVGRHALLLSIRTVPRVRG